MLILGIADEARRDPPLPAELLLLRHNRSAGFQPALR